MYRRMSTSERTMNTEYMFEPDWLFVQRRTSLKRRIRASIEVRLMQESGPKGVLMRNLILALSCSAVFAYAAEPRSTPEREYKPERSGKSHVHFGGIVASAGYSHGP